MKENGEASYFQKDGYRKTLMGAAEKSDLSTNNKKLLKNPVKNNEKVVFEVPLRIKRVLQIILEQDADIITLQECDHYLFLEEKLSLHGYTGRWCQTLCV
jgi:hypothetical protein